MVDPSDFSGKRIAQSLSSPIVFEGATPKDYLGFAFEDLADGQGDRHAVNALSNAKRAVHFQLEALTDALGFSVLHTKKSRGSNFPTRLDFASECGIVASGILRRLNELRNDVEHAYRIPTQVQATNYVHVAELFLEACKQKTRGFPNAAWIHGHVISTVVGSGVMELRAVELSDAAELCRIHDGKATTAAILTVRVDEPQFSQWARILLDP